MSLFCCTTECRGKLGSSLSVARFHNYFILFYFIFPFSFAKVLVVFELVVISGNKKSLLNLQTSPYYKCFSCGIVRSQYPIPILSVTSVRALHRKSRKPQFGRNIRYFRSTMSPLNDERNIARQHVDSH